MGCLWYEGIPVIPPSLTASCDVQVSYPLTMLTTVIMTLDLTISERYRSDVKGTGAVLLQSTHFARETRESGRT